MNYPPHRALLDEDDYIIVPNLLATLTSTHAKIGGQAQVERGDGRETKAGSIINCPSQSTTFPITLPAKKEDYLYTCTPLLVRAAQEAAHT